MAGVPLMDDHDKTDLRLRLNSLKSVVGLIETSYFLHVTRLLFDLIHVVDQ